jgi:hypothetical protein
LRIGRIGVLTNALLLERVVELVDAAVAVVVGVGVGVKGGGGWISMSSFGFSWNVLKPSLNEIVKHLFVFSQTVISLNKFYYI